MVDCQIGSLPGKGEPSMRPDLEEEARSSSFPSSFARLGTTHSPSTTLERSPRRRTPRYFFVISKGFLSDGFLDPPKACCLCCECMCLRNASVSRACYCPQAVKILDPF